jgi:hypothetical protein
MDVNQSSSRYGQLIDELPPTWRHKYHYLAQYGAMFVLMTQLCRRGREGIVKLEKNDFQTFTDPDSGLRYYKKIVGRQEKNHKDDDENLENGGLILFQDNEHNFNPGLYMERFLSLLNKNSPLLFQRPQRRSKRFSLDSNPGVWFEKTCVGPTLVGNMMPDLSEALGLPRLTNGQIRPTTIRTLKRIGAEDREIMSISGHKEMATLNNYNPNVALERQIQLAQAISNGGKKRAREPNQQGPRPSTSASNQQGPRPSTSASNQQGPRPSTSDQLEQHEVHIEEPDDDEDTSEEHALCIMSQADKENHQENRKVSMDVFESLIRREQQLAAIYEIKTAKAHQSLAIAHREGSAKRMKLIQELLVQKKI